MVKITMTIEDALKLAVSALEEQAEESYEGCEREDPDIAEWIRKRETAASLITRQLKVLNDGKS